MSGNFDSLCDVSKQSTNVSILSDDSKVSTETYRKLIFLEKDKRREQENKIISELKPKKSAVNYLIEINWVYDFTAWLKNKSDIPKALNNSNLINKETKTLKCHLKPGKDYM